MCLCGHMAVQISLNVFLKRDPWIRIYPDDDPTKSFWSEAEFLSIRNMMERIHGKYLVDWNVHEMY